ncbi:phosphatase PAP2 family protein [Flavobacterium ginsenosidimutans]|uniref:Phosphatase PAP2 family protein n=1 Tax=Flavobacterium ginsenosidimutans TaxID=687844 RepID=A0ABZ2Q914_9FLAO|nr:phosphatase PAP2 family protein [Flavobacterium ginsenosidimutans]KAF2337933.1 phosphatase PAP2 family protein [Flavobacterium ginsenosidimutans]
MFYKTIFFLFLFGLFSANAQQNDSIAKIDSTSNNLKFNYKQLIAPSILIGYGVIGLESHQLLSFNSQIKEEVTEDIDEKITIDDFSQYAPAASVYALNAFGVKGKNNMRDRSVILVTSYAIMATTVLTLKSVSNVERPDGSSNNSFPSGHTATAFMGAEFLYQEYKDKSIWYGIAGYAVATGTGLFRIYNNRHWLTDVAAGAGIGILSTKIAYWINPYITKKLFKSSAENKSTSMIMPFYNGQQYGLGFAKVF